MNDLLSKRQLVGHTEVDRQGLYKCSTLVKFKVLCGDAAGIRHRTKHNLGDDLSFDDNSHSRIQSPAQHLNYIIKEYHEKHYKNDER